MTATDSGSKYLAPLAVLTTLFFMWGFITCLNDILIPRLKSVFDLNYAQAMLIQLAFFTAYFIMSLPSGSVVNRLGYKNGIIIGLVTAGVGCLLFYPAASGQSYGMFLLALFVLASGITLLQVAANPFVAILGKPETASSRLTMTQALNSLGTTIAPIFGSLLILSGEPVKAADELKRLAPAALEAYRVAEASSVQGPYVGLAIALVLLAVAIGFFKLPKLGELHVKVPAVTYVPVVLGALGLFRFIRQSVGVQTEAEATWNRNVFVTLMAVLFVGSLVIAYVQLPKIGEASEDGPARGGRRACVLGALGIFFYVGAEVAIGSFLVNYFKEPAIGALSEAQGAFYVSLYWGGAMVGRFIGSAITLRRYRPSRVLMGHAIVAAGLVLITMATSGVVAMGAIIAVGLFNSIMFPTIFTMGIDGLGKHTGKGSGLLCMAIVGGALIPVIQGSLADRIGIHHCFIIPVVCYLFIAWYGMSETSPVRPAAVAAPSV